MLERTQIGPSSTVRFLGAIPLDRMRLLAEANSAPMKAIGSSVVDRMKATERIYNRHGMKPEQRLCGLLGHLLMHCAVPGREYDFMIEGPTQTGLADALSLSIGRFFDGIAPGTHLGPARTHTAVVRVRGRPAAGPQSPRCAATKPGR